MKHNAHEFRGSQMTLVERLAEASGNTISLAHSVAALVQAERDLPGNWESVWQDRLSTAMREIGLQARNVWLSPAEIAGSLRAGQPCVSFRRTAANPDGWVLLLDRRWGKVFRADLSGGAGAWVDIRDVARELEQDAEQRLPWLLCDPVLPRIEAEHANGHPRLPPLRRLAQLVRPDRGDLWSVVVFGVLVGALTLATPVAVQQLVNSVALGGLMQPVVVLALLLLAGLAFSGVLSALQAYVAEIVQRRIFVRVVADLAYRLPRVQLEAFDRQHGPELVNRFFDVMTVQKVGATLLLDGVALLLQTVIGLLVLSFYHPLMLAFSILLLAGIAVVVFVVGRGAVDTAIVESRSKYAVAGWLEEMARHAAALKTSGAARFATERADALARDYLRARSTHYRIVFRQLGGALGLQVLASSGLLGLGGGLVIAGQLTIGQLVASELIVTAIVASFAKLGKHLESYYDLLAAVDKLGHLFDLPLERDGGVIHEPPDGGAALTFRDVTFRYGDRIVLDGLDFDIAPGEKVAIVGPSGAGKSTVLDIAFGLRQPASGQVLLDGIDLRELRLEAVREQVVCVRGAEIVEGSLEDNVRMGRAHVTATAVREALAAVGLMDHVLELPEGLRTHLSTGGGPLSRGQAVRLAFARAIAGKPRLILIDAALVDLDTESSWQAMDALLASDAPWSVLATSANRELARRCERCIYLSSETPRTKAKNVARPSDAEAGAA